MSEILFHPRTKLAVDATISARAHALLLTGPAGSGKYTVAEYIAQRLLSVDSLENHPYFKQVGFDGSISVEDIRGIRQFLSLKTTGTGTVRRVVLIENADNMNDESQNALLKSLEEPPLDTVLILTASDPERVRATIRSRAQTIEILAPPREDIEKYFTAKGHEASEVGRIFNITAGLVGLMTAMLSENKDHPLAQHIEIAKQLLGMSMYERLAKVDELSKQKQSTILLVSALKLIAISALRQSALKGQDTVVKRWRETLVAISDAERALRHNGNSKLLLTNLILSIR